MLIYSRSFYSFNRMLNVECSSRMYASVLFASAEIQKLFSLIPSAIAMWMPSKTKSISNGCQEISHNCRYFLAMNKRQIVENKPVLVRIYRDYDPV